VADASARPRTASQGSTGKGSAGKGNAGKGSSGKGSTGKGSTGKGKTTQPAAGNLLFRPDGKRIEPAPLASGTGQAKGKGTGKKFRLTRPLHVDQDGEFSGWGH